MKSRTPITEEGIVVGNVYPKYSTKNPLARYLVRGYLSSLDRLVITVNPGSIHEVGCGEGFIISRFVEKGRTLTGSDFSRKTIDEARRNSPDPSISFKVASIYELTPQDSASLILCCEVLEHLESPEKALGNLAKIANPYLLVSVPREPIWRILNVLRGSYLGSLGNTPGHFQHWSRSSFLHFLGQYFEVLKVETPLPWIMALCRKRS